ncbi:MAG: hypothetical protein SF053_06700 [Bacteroidia bacterium]|nr:hypothetical protein [Bacteroidia bacterium]
MKHLYFHLVFVLGVVSVYGQHLTLPEPQLFSGDYKFTPRAIAQHRIRTVKIDAYMPNSRHADQPVSGQVLQYDKSGRLSKEISLRAHDTTQIRSLSYTDNGKLSWEKTEDRAQRKTTGSGYRLNSNQSVYQVKSYEILESDQKMLLDTRQYIYNPEDSSLAAIKVLENQRVVSVTRYEYENRRVSVEKLENSRGETLKTIRYTYDARGNVVRVLQSSNGITQEYRYTYDQRNLVNKVEWLENNTPKGLITYTYDSRGLVTQLSRSQMTAKGEEVIVKNFSYDVF